VSGDRLAALCLEAPAADTATPEPAASPEPPMCPFCDSTDIELISPWGGQLITSAVRCRSCNTHFEAVRHAFDAPASAVAASD
jgi:hypothetical protein